MNDFMKKAFKVYDKEWALVTAGNMENFNTMTISWGGLGTIWNKPVATVYVKPIRHTHSFLDSNEYFTVSFFDEKYKKDLGVLGTLSGRDGDKVAKTSLTPVALERGVGFAQSELTFVCRKVFSQQFDINCVPEKWREGVYSRYEPHYMYIGYIEDAFGEV